MPTIKQTSRNYQNPYRPIPIRLFNGVSKLTGMFRSLDAEALLQKAKTQTKLEDFGEGFEENGIFRLAFFKLIECLNNEAQLTPFGVFVQQTRLLSALKTRLRIADLIKKHPEILEVDLGRQIIIAGLQRTGTTTLHRLIASDPNMRSLVSWEALNPLPVENEIKGKPVKRIKLAQQAEKALAYMAPEFFAIHPVEHDAPEEDILLLDLCFMSQAPEATFHVPSYAAWLEQQNHEQAYQYLKTVLKVLHWYEGKPNWVLKTPHHMEYTDVILKVFPKALIVQTHRDPQKTTGSFCSMVAHGRGVFSDSVDPKEVAYHWTNKVERMMRRSIEVRKTANPERFIDISYYDLLSNPIDEIQKIYDAADIFLEQSSRQAMSVTQNQNKQHRYGKHIYFIEDFGLTDEQVEEKYRFYREHYHIPVE